MGNVWNFKAETGYKGKVKGWEASDAAEEAWEFMCSRDPDNYRGGDIEVWKDGEPRQKFHVEVESVPSFHATLVEPEESKSNDSPALPS